MKKLNPQPRLAWPHPPGLSMCGLACLLYLLAMGTPMANAQNDQPVRLVAGQAIERELKGGQAHSYELMLEAGQFVQVTVEQLGINVRATLRKPDSIVIVEADSHRGARGVEQACAIAPITNAAGQYELQIRSMRELAVPGKYRVSVTALRTATAQDRERIAAQTEQYERGEVLRRKTDVPSWQQAVEAYQSALRTWRVLGDRQREADVLSKLSEVLCLMLRKQESVEYAEQALVVYRALADRSGEAEALFALGQAYRMRRESGATIESYEQSLQLCREIGERYGAGLSLYWLAPFYSERGEKQRALACAQEAALLLHAAGERGHEGFALLKTGETYNALGEKLKAIAAYQQAHALFQADSQPVLTGGTLNEIGQIYATQGDTAQAQAVYGEALSIFQAIGNSHVEAPLGAGRALLALGRLADLQGDKPQAVGYYQQALFAYQSPNGYSGEATARRYLSETYRLLGEWQKALDQNYQAWLFCHDGGDRNAEAGALADLAFVHLELGDGEQALSLYDQARQIYRARNDREAEAHTLTFTGIAYNSLGERQRAIECLKQAIALCQAVESRQREAFALSVIATIYEATEGRQQAQDAYARALSICRAVGDRHLEGSLLIALGYHAESSDKRQSLELYEQAATLYHRMGNCTGEASALIGLGRTYALSDQLQKAVELHHQALQLARTAAEPREEAKAFFSLAQLERRAGQLPAARQHLEAALRLIESLRAHVASPDLRASYLATTQDYFGAYTDLLMQLHRQDPNSGHDAEALQANERRRARSLLELLGAARTDRQGALTELVERETRLQEQINEKLLTLRNAGQATAGQPPEQMAERNRQFNALSLDLQQVRDQIYAANPNLAALSEAQPLGLAEIRQQLDPDTLLLEYALGGERSYLWAVTADSINVFELPDRDQINKQARKIHQLLSDQQSRKTGETSLQWQQRANNARRQFPAAAAELSRTVIGPVASLLGQKRLLIVADGALQYVPFAALSASSSPLIVDHEIVNLPSASTIAVLRRELDGRVPAPNSLVILADPVFTEDDERLKHSVSKLAADKLATNKPPTKVANRPADNKAPGDLIRSARETGGLDAQGNLGRLPRTKVEAEAIVKSASGQSPRLAMSFDASRQLAMSGELGQYRIIHFATHGLINSKHPELSGVVLSLFDRAGRPQNGFLRLQDIYNLKLPADLVVLSACQTALGQEISGEGLIGLTRGFMHAGAPRVVASLWNVDDRATAELMKRFYEGMLGPKRLRPAAALRAAQVSMWRDGRWNQPYDWAAFVLEGEWR